MKKLLYLCAALAVLSGGLRAEESFRLKIEAGDHDRTQTPIVADLSMNNGAGFAEPAEIELIAEADSSPRVAQAEWYEDDGDRRVRIYWVEPGLAAGDEKHFRLSIGSASGDQDQEFSFQKEDEGRDIVYGGEPVARYVTVYDPDRHMDTHKPYHHVYGFHDDGFITKGPGGLYDHHKGIYLGWNHTHVGDERWDFWHASEVSLQHREFLEDRELLGPVVAREATVNEWIDPDDVAVVRDIREVTVWRLDGNEWVFDYNIRIEALGGDISLRGDAHHAGFQFRASQEVAERDDETRYIMPDGAESLPNGIWANVPWVAFDFPIGEERYVVTHMDHPENPEETTYSTRDYGRFGAFFEYELKEGEPLNLRYRILVQDAADLEEDSPAYFAKRHADFAQPVQATVIGE